MKKIYIIPTTDLLVYLSSSLFGITTAWWVSTIGGPDEIVSYGVFQALFLLVLTPSLAPFCEKMGRVLLIKISIVFLIIRSFICFCLSLNDFSFEILLFSCFLDSMALAIYMPISKSLIPDMVHHKQLESALSLQKRFQQIGSISGPGLAGMLLSFDRGHTVGYVAVALFTTAALLIQFYCKYEVKIGQSMSNEPWKDSLTKGFKVMAQIPLELCWNIRTFFLLGLLTPMLITLVPLYLKELELDSSWFGILELFYGVGAIAGTLTYKYFVRYVSRAYTSIIAMSLVGCFLILFAQTDLMEIKVTLFFLIGILFTTNQINGQSYRLLAIPKEMRVRFNAISFTNIRLAATCGISLAGYMLKVYSIETTYIVFGAIIFAVSFTTLIIPGYHEFMSLSKSKVDNFYRERFPHLF